MPSLGELKDSETRLMHRPARSDPVYADMKWRDIRIGRVKIPLARVQLRGLGFTEPATYGNVMRAIARRNLLCPPDLVDIIAALIDEPDECFYLGMRPFMHEGTYCTFVCTGATPSKTFTKSVSPPNHWFYPGTEIVYPLRTN